MDIKKVFSEVPRMSAEPGISRRMYIKEVVSKAPGLGAEHGSSRGMDIKDTEHDMNIKEVLRGGATTAPPLSCATLSPPWSGATPVPPWLLPGTTPSLPLPGAPAPWFQIVFYRIPIKTINTSSN